MVMQLPLPARHPCTRLITGLNMGFHWPCFYRRPSWASSDLCVKDLSVVSSCKALDAVSAHGHEPILFVIVTQCRVQQKQSQNQDNEHMVYFFEAEYVRQSHLAMNSLLLKFHFFEALRGPPLGFHWPCFYRRPSWASSDLCVKDLSVVSSCKALDAVSAHGHEPILFVIVTQCRVLQKQSQTRTTSIWFISLKQNM